MDAARRPEQLLFRLRQKGVPGGRRRVREVIMRMKQIEALMRAHQGRARPVASLHVLRQSRLEADDHEFLLTHAAELGPSDLLRWRSRCEPGFTGVVVREIARRAVVDPAGFRHEILDAPKLDIDEDEWRELADLLRGKVPDGVFAIVLERGGPRPKRPPAENLFTPGLRVGEPVKLDDSDLEGGDPVDLEAARLLPLSRLLMKRKRGLLTISGEELAVVALERAQADEEDWSVLATEIPGELREAVLEKAARTPRCAERANLLGWLARHDVPRKTLFAMALLSPPAGGFGFGLVDWLARSLTTRSAWDQHGAGVFDAFIELRAFGELAELVTLSISESQREKGEPPRGYVESLHVALATTLVARARRSIAAGDDAAAMRALSALVCLDPPSRVSRAIHDLRRIDGLSSDLLELVGINERMVRRSNASDASLEGVVAALHALAD